MLRRWLATVAALLLMAWSGTGSASILHATAATRAARIHVSELPAEDEEEWYSIYVLGERAGYAHYLLEASTYRGEDVLKVTTEIYMELGRGESVLVTTTTESAYYRRGDGLLLYYVELSDQNGLTSRVEGQVVDGVLTVATSTGESTTREEYALEGDPPFLEQAIDAELESRWPMEVGDSFTVSGFDPDHLDVVDVTFEVLGEDVYSYDGEDVPVRVVQYTVGDLVAILWMSDDRESFREDVGGFMSVRRTSRDEALAALGDVDVMLGTRVPIRGEMPASARETLTVRATLASGQAAGLFAANDRQLVLAAEDPRSVYVRVRPVTIHEDEVLSLPIGGNGLATYLEPTLYVESDHPQIVAQAREIVGEETNSLYAARALVTWVYRNISTKSYSVGFASAAQTLRSREGDCTEHAVLFAALARAVGIPSTICMGILPLQDGYGYYHAWASVYVGQWVAVDPAFNEHQADARHILLAESTGDEASMTQVNFRMIRTIGVLELEIWEGGLPTAVAMDAGAEPTLCVLLPNVPNPFNAQTLIRYTLPRPADVELVIYDVLGQPVARLVDAPQLPGEHTVAWDGEGLASGVYFCRLTTGTEVRRRSMALVR